MKLTQIKPGDRIVATGGFLCLNDEEALEVFVEENSNRLWVPCDDGRHYLDLDTARNDRDELLGWSPAKAEATA